MTSVFWPERIGRENRLLLMLLIVLLILVAAGTAGKDQSKS